MTFSPGLSLVEGWVLATLHWLEPFVTNLSSTVCKRS